MSSRPPLPHEDLEHVYSHTQPLWEELRGQNIFVTGGTGFFGRWLVETFAHVNRRLKLQSTMVVLTRNAGAFRESAPHLARDPAIRFAVGDVRTLEAGEIRSQLGSGAPQKFAAVIHAATEASAKLNAENPLLMVDTIVQGTRAALEFAVAMKADNFLLTSSGAVYGPQPTEITHLPEDYAGAPDCLKTASAYGEGKRLAELFCAIYSAQYGLRTKIARCFAFVGPHLPLDSHFAIGNFIRDALCGKPIRVGGDGTPRRSYLYAADLAIWLWTILLKGKSGYPYNVGSRRDLSIAEVAQTVNIALGGKGGVSIVQTPTPGIPTQRYVPDPERAGKELKLCEWVPLESAICRTAEWHRLGTPGLSSGG